MGNMISFRVANEQQVATRQHLSSAMAIAVGALVVGALVVVIAAGISSVFAVRRQTRQTQAVVQLATPMPSNGVSQI
jgi:hypothetical protein